MFNLHRWDHFRSFSTFFDEVKPSFIVIREAYGGMNVGMGLDNKGLLRYDIKYGETLDRYYQGIEFTGQDTSDVTKFRHLTTGLMIERNSLNRKQHPNAGESLMARCDRWAAMRPDPDPQRQQARTWTIGPNMSGRSPR
ncbi:MAG: hypothetical protein IPO05_17710 [Flavobacteriales bacterium]|nr:hypothetical protein [Flavobacteriales bacterium]